MTSEQELEKLQEWTGSPMAAQMLLALGKFSQQLDDVVDEKMTSLERSATLTEAVSTFLSKVAACRYWAENAHWLMPMVIRAFIDWDFSNVAQRGRHPSQHVHGFVRREAMDGLVVAVATQLNGIAWGRRVARELHEFYHMEHLGSETVETWVAEVSDE